jgi:hypothetical protein
MLIVVDPKLLEELSGFAEEVGLAGITFVTSAPGTKAVVLGKFGDQLRFSGVRHEQQRKQVEKLEAILKEGGYSVQSLD